MCASGNDQRQSVSRSFLRLFVTIEVGSGTKSSVFLTVFLLSEMDNRLSALSKYLGVSLLSIDFKTWHWACSQCSAELRKTTPMKTNLMRTFAPFAIATGLALGFASSAPALQIDYSSNPSSFIVFPGDTTFQFAPAVSQFSITDGTASGLLGEITGIYTIGTITTVGGVSSAPVTGTGTFVVHDGAFNLVGTLTWVSILQIGSGVTLNVQGTANLTNITYGGSNADLLALAGAGSGSNTLTFQFVPGVSLTTLRNGPGPNQTSFSGSISPSVPDGGTTVALLGLGLAAVEGVRRWMRGAKSRG
jgi:hypothetical protein